MSLWDKPGVSIYFKRIKNLIDISSIFLFDKVSLSTLSRVNYAKSTIIYMFILNHTFMRGFHTNIEKDTLGNNAFRKVLYTTTHNQLVLMSLKPHEDIGMEIHPNNDQFFRFEQGQGKCIIDGNEYGLSDGTVIIVPAGSEHNIINISDTEPLKMYTLYSPPHHKDGIVRITKEEAIADDPEFDGVTTE